uniref:Uncharacterized protein n=1 Tax=Amphimedon queenslandica TaxID=400682 RepID=A0A1X7TZ85_AMPQE
MASLITETVLKTLKESDPKKLFFHLYRLPHFGVGRRFVRVTWGDHTVKGKEEDGGKQNPPTFWTITRVQPDGELKGGQVWGNLTWKGNLDPKERRILSHDLRDWKLILLNEDEKKTNYNNP